MPFPESLLTPSTNRAISRWSAFLRSENLSGKTYAGTVIVNEANRRYFEPAAGRIWLAGATVTHAW